MWESSREGLGKESGPIDDSLDPKIARCWIKFADCATLLNGLANKNLRLRSFVLNLFIEEAPRVSHASLSSIIEIHTNPPFRALPRPNGNLTSLFLTFSLSLASFPFLRLFRQTYAAALKIFPTALFPSQLGDLLASTQAEHQVPRRLF